MIRRLAIGVAGAAIATAGLVAVGAGGAGAAAPPAFGAAASSNITCNITAKATLTPSLKNNWVKADHQSDPDAAVRALPDTQFASFDSVGVSSKAKGTCSGSATDTGGHVFTATSVKIGLVVLTPSVDNPPLHNNGGDTCIGLIAGTAPEDTPATYKSDVTLKGSGAKVAPFTISGSTIAPSGLGFAITGGTVSAPFAGATGNSQANVDGATITAFTAPAPTSTAPKAASKCQPSLKVKKGVATLKAPKGLGKIGIASGTFSLQK